MSKYVYFIIGENGVVTNSYEYDHIISFYNSLITVGYKDIVLKKKKLSKLTEEEKQLIEESNTGLVKLDLYKDLYIPYTLEEFYSMKYGEYVTDLEYLMDSMVNKVLEYLKFDEYDKDIIDKFENLLSFKIEVSYETYFTDTIIDDYKFYLKFLKEYYVDKE